MVEDSTGAVVEEVDVVTNTVVTRVSDQVGVDSETEMDPDVSRLGVGVTVAWVDEPDTVNVPRVVADVVTDRVDRVDDPDRSTLVGVIMVEVGAETGKLDVVRVLLQVVGPFGASETLSVTDEKPVHVSAMYVGVLEKKTLPVDSPSPPPPGDPGTGQESPLSRALRFGKP